MDTNLLALRDHEPPTWNLGARLTFFGKEFWTRQERTASSVISSVTYPSYFRAESEL